ncbi:MAG: hypothetical protein E6K16_02250, partial [Methanobacteriota archaeon]
MVAGMYAYPAYPSQTEKGLRNISIAMVVFLLVQILIIGLLLAVAPIIAQVSVGGNPTPELIAAALTLLALVCVLVIVYIIGLVFGLIGLTAIHKGRDEFGPEHAKRLDRSIIVLILGIFIPAAITGIGSAGGAFGAGSVGLTARISFASAAASLAGGIVGSLLVGLFLLWSIEALTTPLLRARAMIALVLGIVAGAAGGAAYLIVLATVPAPTTPAGYQPFILPGVVSPAISVISLAVW